MQTQQLLAMHEAEVEARKAEAEALRAEIAARLEAEAKCERYRQLYMEVLEKCKMLKNGIIAGQRAERLSGDEAQLTLAVLGTLLGGQAPESKPKQEQQVEGHERSKPTGRKPLPDHLPRIDVEIVPDEVMREGLDAFERIGEEVSEVVERRRAAMLVVRSIRGKYKRKDRKPDEEVEILIAEPLELPLERGLAGPGMLADRSSSASAITCRCTARSRSSPATACPRALRRAVRDRAQAQVPVAQEAQEAAARELEPGARAVLRLVRAARPDRPRRVAAGQGDAAGQPGAAARRSLLTTCGSDFRRSGSSESFGADQRCGSVLHP